MRPLVLLLALSTLSACGLKGDLFLPPPKPKPATAVQPAPSAPSDRAPVEDGTQDDKPAGGSPAPR